MNVEIGTEAIHFLFWEYVHGIFVVVYSLETMTQAKYKPAAQRNILNGLVAQQSMVVGVT
jgi:hypothetical protein